MNVAVIAMRVVQLLFDEIVDVIAMGNRLVTTVGTVLVAGLMTAGA